MAVETVVDFADAEEKPRKEGEQQLLVLAWFFSAAVVAVSSLWHLLSDNDNVKLRQHMQHLSQSVAESQKGKRKKGNKKGKEEENAKMNVKQM